MNHCRLLGGPLTIALLTACGGAIPRIDPVVLDTAQQRRVEATAEQLDRGRTIYIRRCSSCHTLVTPSRRSPAGWADELAEMGPKAKLDAEQTRLVLAYLTATGR